MPGTEPGAGKTVINQTGTDPALTPLKSFSDHPTIPRDLVRVPYRGIHSRSPPDLPSAAHVVPPPTHLFHLPRPHSALAHGWPLYPIAHHSPPSQPQPHPLCQLLSNLPSQFRCLVNLSSSFQALSSVPGSKKPSCLNLPASGELPGPLSDSPLALYGCSSPPGLWLPEGRPRGVYSALDKSSCPLCSPQLPIHPSPIYPFYFSQWPEGPRPSSVVTGEYTSRAHAGALFHISVDTGTECDGGIDGCLRHLNTTSSGLWLLWLPMGWLGLLGPSSVPSPSPWASRGVGSGPGKRQQPELESNRVSAESWPWILSGPASSSEKCCRQPVPACLAGLL